MTSSTAGVVTFSVHEIWLAAWLREWEDIGKLHWRRESREHIGHENRLRLSGNEYCECFNCRVMVAWEKGQQASQQEFSRQFMKPKKVPPRGREAGR